MGGYQILDLLESETRSSSGTGPTIKLPFTLERGAVYATVSSWTWPANLPANEKATQVYLWVDSSLDGTNWVPGANEMATAFSPFIDDVTPDLRLCVRAETYWQNSIEKNIVTPFDRYLRVRWKVTLANTNVNFKVQLYAL